MLDFPRCLFLLTVMLNLFQHLATVEFHGYAKRLPQGRNMGQTLKQVQGDVKMRCLFFIRHTAAVSLHLEGVGALRYLYWAHSLMHQFFV